MGEKIGDRIKTMRNERKLKQAELAAILGVSPSTVGMYEQNRREPDDKTKIAICKYFDISMDYLVGTAENKEKPIYEDELTEHEQKLLRAYRTQPEVQVAVDRILGIQNENKILLFNAASSESNRQPKITPISSERLEKIANAPETDQNLL